MKVILLTAGFRTGRKKNAIGGERQGLPSIAVVWVQLLLCITDHTTKIYEVAQ